MLAIEKYRSWSLRHYITFWLVLYVLIIGQDYIYSVLRHTGFYWSEVLVFNSYWLLFIPISFFIKKMSPISWFQEKSIPFKMGCSLMATFVFSITHLLIFASLITVISQLFFTPPHRFMTTLISSVSNDFYLTILVYFFVTYVFQSAKRKTITVPSNSSPSYPKILSIKHHKQQIQIEVSSIFYFETNKPYTTLYTENEKYLWSENLKTIEQTLDPDLFLRIHRSTIVHKTYISKLMSRKNGDYDIVLKNNHTLRMSRHYRKNWEHLLHKER